MIRATLTLPPKSQFTNFRASAELRLREAASRAVDRAAMTAKRNLRGDMDSAGLGKLKNVIGAGSDYQKGRVLNLPGGRFRVSGWIYIKSARNERTSGAIKAYTEGADIRPVNGRWLWIATANIPPHSGRKRMTPALYKANGFESKIGPLQFVQGRHGGEALLIIKTPVSAKRTGSGAVRRLPKRGSIGATREKKENVVAFVGIRQTRRPARVNPRAIIQAAAQTVPAAVADFLGSNG